MLKIWLALIAGVLLAFVYLSRKYQWENALLMMVFGPPAMIAYAAMSIYQRIPGLPKSEAMLVDNSMRALRRSLRGQEPVVTDTRSGTVCYLICKTDDDMRQLIGRHDKLLERLQEELRRRGIDSESRSLRYTSEEEIQRGGGGFHFWRDRGDL